MLFKQIKRSIILRTNKFYWKFLLLPFFIIPKLKRENLISNNYEMIHVHNGIIFIEDNSVHKIGIGKYQTPKKENQLRQIAVNRWVELDNILTDCEYINIQNTHVLTMPLYNFVNKDMAVKHGILLYESMKKFKENHDTDISISSFKDIKKGLDIIKKRYGDNKYIIVERLVKNFFQKGVFSIGFCHGDFHSRNILIDKNKKSRLIDLDCINVNGVQDFDALHFILEYFWEKNDDYWCKTLKKLLNDDIPAEFNELLESFSLKVSPGLYLAYFVNRLGLEKNNYDFDCPRRMTNLVIDSI